MGYPPQWQGSNRDELLTVIEQLKESANRERWATFFAAAAAIGSLLAAVASWLVVFGS